MIASSIPVTQPLVNKIRNIANPARQYTARWKYSVAFFSNKGRMAMALQRRIREHEELSDTVEHHVEIV